MAQANSQILTPTAKEPEQEVCPKCKSNKYVYYDSKGGYLGEHIYWCKKCDSYFLVKEDEEMGNNTKNNFAFIDSQNLNLAIRDCNWTLDFKKFYIHLKHKYRIDKMYLFIGYVSGNERLYTALQKMGYVVIFKPTLEYKKKEAKYVKIKGNVDAELVLYCMLEYNNFDKAIIVSGDGDFYCLVEQLEKDNKLLNVGIPNKKSFSALLRRFGPYHFYVSRLRHKLEYKK